MNVLIIFISVIAGIIALLFIIALFMKREHYVKREIIIHAPRQRVFDFLKLLKNQENFNQNAMADSDRKKEFKGTDGTVGFIYSWTGNKDAGEGQKEIKKILDGKSIEIEIRFVKPMHATATIIMETESLPDDQTKVSWSNAGILKYPLNILVPMVEKHGTKDMDISLSTLKDIFEK
jgi:hypothetical protein